MYLASYTITSCKLSSCKLSYLNLAKSAITTCKLSSFQCWAVEYDLIVRGTLVDLKSVTLIGSLLMM